MHNNSKMAASIALYACLEQFWRASADRLMNRARRFADGRDEIAEEFVATALLKLVAYLRGAARPVDDIESLAFVTLRNVAFDHWRQRRREASGLASVMEIMEEGSGVPGAEEILLSRHRYQRVLAVVESEPGTTRSLFYKRFIEELSYTEIAEELAISETLARKRVQTLRRRLKASVDTENPTAPVTPRGSRRPNKGRH